MENSIGLLFLFIAGLIIFTFPKGMQAWNRWQAELIGLPKKYSEAREIYVRLVGLLFMAISTLRYFGYL
jgi:hypothetical protein